MKCFILAAGLGTRLKPLTDSTPKALVSIGSTTPLEYVIKKTIKSGFSDIIINTHHFADQVIAYLKKNNNFGINISISDERNLLLDTGGGLKKAAQFFNDGKPFLVHNVDILSDIDLNSLYEFHLNQNALVTLAVQKRESSRYFLFDEERFLCGWGNNKTNETKIVREPIGELHRLAFSGIHIADPKVFSLMPSKEVFSLVELFLGIASFKRITYFEHTDSHFLDLGKIESLKEAEQLISQIV